MFNTIKQGGKLLAIVAGIAGICAMALSAGAGARDGVNPAVSARIAVESHKPQVWVKVTIDNQSEQTIFVPRLLLKQGQAENNLFEVRDSSNGDPLDYIGTMVKRPAPTNKDFVAVKPHASVSNTLDITQSYRFVSGRHAYQIGFTGSYLTDLSTPEQSTQLEPASAMFAHVAP